MNYDPLSVRNPCLKHDTWAIYTSLKPLDKLYNEIKPWNVKLLKWDKNLVLCGGIAFASVELPFLFILRTMIWLLYMYFLRPSLFE